MPDSLERLKSALAGRYTVEREIGRGGMATVYLAEDVKHNRRVAVKLLDREIAATLGTDRFLREIAIVARLEHPHILTLLDSGEADGVPYYVMPYIEGESLRGRLEREGQLPVEDAIAIASGVASALAYAHEHDIVHRDIKPANILLSAGEAVVADFGIARAITEAGAGSMTRTGISVGSPMYMSPEQASGSQVDGRSDIYSLGCVLYEMLAGQPPLSGSTPQATRAKRLTEAPSPIRGVRRAVPEAVDEVIARSLNPVPADRFATAAEFADALGHAADTVEAEDARRQRVRSASAEGRSRDGRPAALAALVILAAGVIWLFAASPFGPRGTSDSPAVRSADKTIAVLPFENLGGTEADEGFVDGMHNDILTHLHKISGLSPISRTSVMEYRDATYNLRQIAEELGVATVMEGSVQRSGNRVRINVQLIDARTDEHLWAEIYDRELTAENLFAIQTDVAGEIARALQAELSPAELERIEVVPTDNLEAYDYYLRGEDHFRRRMVEQDATAAVRMFERAVELDPTFAMAHAALSRAHTWLYYDHGLQEELSRGRTAVDEALRLAPDLAEAHLALGDFYYYGQKDFGRALEEYGRALERHPGNAQAIAQTGFVQRRQGDWDGSAASIERALELDPRNTELVRSLGINYFLMRRYSEAERYLRRLISLAPDISSSYGWLAATHLARDGDTASARIVLDEGLAGEDRASRSMAAGRLWILIDFFPQRYASALEGFGPESSRDTAEYYLARAQISERMAHPLSARASYDSARVVLEMRSRMSTGTQVRPSLSTLGVANAGSGRPDEAVRRAQEAVERLPVAADAVQGVFFLRDLARVYIMVGEYERALDELEILLTIPSELSVPLLQAAPFFDPLRDHPRFQELVSREDQPD